LPRRRAEIARLETFLVEERPPGRLLELGCGGGDRLARMLEMGWDAVGVELDPVAAERARSKHQVEVRVGDVEDVGFEPGQFDAVVSNHVIEHLPDPIRTMSAIVPLMRPGGVFVAVTPNVQSLGHRWFGRHWYGLDVPRHLTLFSEKSIRNAATKAGLEVEAAWGTACRAEQVFTRSAEARWLTRLPPRIRTAVARVVGGFLQAPATAQCRRRSDTGEELVIVARRAGTVS
jgi:2-polyprenyl-3-methyl-5-hydroxy-6-metoxy-1,4-benzoquinol methylase